MDFGALLHVARKNSESVKNAESKFYSTKFSAPKKETKEKRLSDNIKKFLAKKEQEEKEKARTEKEKLQRLLAMRDEKSKNKIRKMLKVTKSANKSVLEDAVDNENTAVTLQGPDQPDEDDYGYVSHEAAAFYQKYMDKVKGLPEENKFTPSKSKVKTDLSGTKDRVKEAIKREQEEKNSIHRSSKLSSSKPSDSLSSSSSLSKSRKDLYDPEVEREREREEQKIREEERRKVKLKKPAPPPMDFKELLRLAEKKQFEPVEIEVKVEKEPERLLTKKQKKELEERKAYLEERGKKERGGAGNQNSNNDKPQPLNGKLSKTNDTTKISSSNSNLSAKNEFKKPSSTISSAPSKMKLPSNSKPNNYNEVTRIKNQLPNSSSGSSGSNIRNEFKPANNQTQSKAPISTLNKPNRMNTKPTSALTPSSQKSSTSTKPSSAGLNSSVQNQQQRVNYQKPSINSKTSKEIKSRPFPPPMPEKERTRQFPPPDVRSNNRPIKKPPMKRRIIDDDEDEYDSELDDFIDDGPEDRSENYSSYIKEIFGYDKSRYRYLDEDDQDMESSFVQQMKEEQISKKIGLMEDLEDMRLEAEEKRRKAQTKKKKK